MPKYIGDSKVVDTKTKGQPEGKVLVKLRADGENPRWVKMDTSEYEKRLVVVK